MAAFSGGESFSYEYRSVVLCLSLFSSSPCWKIGCAGRTRQEERLKAATYRWRAANFGCTVTCNDWVL